MDELCAALKHRLEHSPVAALPTGRRAPSSLPGGGGCVAAGRRHGGNKNTAGSNKNRTWWKQKIGAPFS